MTAVDPSYSLGIRLILGEIERAGYMVERRRWVTREWVVSNPPTKSEPDFAYLFNLVKGKSSYILGQYEGGNWMLQRLFYNGRKAHKLWKNIEWARIKTKLRMGVTI